MEMRERIARALFDHEWRENKTESQWANDMAYWLAEADVALDAMPECTPEMYKAGEIAIEQGSGANHVWQAMLAAARGS